MIINNPTNVVTPPKIMNSFRIWPGNNDHAINDAINGSPKGIDATIVGLKYLTK